MAGTYANRVRPAARGTQRSLDGLLRGDRPRRCCRAWLAGHCHCGLGRIRVEIRSAAELGPAPTLDVADVHSLVLAVVIRMIGGLATVAQLDAAWLYPFATWTSWLVPLLVFEFIQIVNPPIERVAASS